MKVAADDVKLLSADRSCVGADGAEVAGFIRVTGLDGGSFRGGRFPDRWAGRVSRLDEPCVDALPDGTLVHFFGPAVGRPDQPQRVAGVERAVDPRAQAAFAVGDCEWRRPTIAFQAREPIFEKAGGLGRILRQTRSNLGCDPHGAGSVGKNLRL